MAVSVVVFLAASLKQSSTTEEKLEHSFDMFMGAIGFAGVHGAVVSGFWFLGGKDLHQRWVEETLIPALKMNLAPHSYLPHK